MENSITDKLNKLSFDSKYDNMVSKFLATLANGIVSTEEFDNIINFLNSKGIIIKKPSHLSILANGYDYIQTTVNEYEKNGWLDLIVENPLRINCKSALNRLDYCKQNNIPYLNDKGKCIPAIYNSADFETLKNENNNVNDIQKEVTNNTDAFFAETEMDELQFAKDFINENNNYSEAPIMPEAPILPDTPVELSTQEEIISEAPVTEPIFTETPAETIVEEQSSVVEEQPTVSEVVISPFTETNTVEGQIIAPVVDNSAVNEMPVDNTNQMVVSEEPVKEVAPQESTLDIQTETSDVTLSTDPIVDILSKPQTIALNDEMFERYDTLSESIRQVLYRVYNVEEVNDTIINNLIKLVTNEISDDKFVIYTAITYGKNVSEEEKMALENAIAEELEYTNIMNVGLGRIA